MEHLTSAGRQAVEQSNWHAAIALALTLPDICGRIEAPDIKPPKTRYIDWCERFLSPRYSIAPSPSDPEARIILRGSDCYALRCAVLHEGADDIVEQKAREALAAFEFVEPPPAGSRLPSLVWDLKAGILGLQVDIFCEAICQGVEEWQDRVVAQDADAQSRVSSLMRVRSPGSRRTGSEGTFSMMRVLTDHDPGGQPI